MTESIYKEYQNKYYNPNDNDKKPGDNDNWKSIQKGFHDISEKQLETSAGLTLGKGTEDETSVTAAELKEIKDPTQLETSGGLTLGKGTEDETSVTAAELAQMKQGGGTIARTFKSNITNVSFTSGWNVKTLYTEGFYSPGRLNGFTPGRNYIVTGTWIAASNDATKGAFGTIPAIERVANDNGQIDIGTSITYLGISSGAFTPEGSVEMRLVVTERG